MPEDTPKPTILTIHGAWHHPAYFSSVISLLSEQGYSAVCPHLPTCNNDDPPTKTLEDDVALIRNMASSLADEGHEIVVLMHSYGGVVGTDALYGLGTKTRAKKGLSGGVQRLIYMCAFIPRMGQSLAGIFGGGLPPWTQEKANGILHPSNPNAIFYNDVTDPDHWSAQLVKHPKIAQYTAVSHEAFREVPVTYLLCEKDKAIPVEVQKMMIDKMEESGVKVGRIESCQGSHSPFLSMPEKVVEVVVRAAQEKV